MVPYRVDFIRERFLALLRTLSPREIVYDDREFPPLYVKSRKTEDETQDFIDMWLSQNAMCREGEHAFPIGIPRSDRHRPDRLNLEKFLARQWDEFYKTNPFIKKNKKGKG